MIVLNYNYKPVLNNISFCRKEPDGTYTIRGYADLHFLSIFDSRLFDCLLRNENVGKIFVELSSLFPTSSVEKIINKTIKSLESFEISGLLKRKKEKWYMTNDGLKIADEIDFTKLSRFINKRIDSSDNIKFLYNNKEFYNPRNIRSLSMNMRSTFFISTSNDEINGFISIDYLSNSNGNCELSGFAFNDTNDFNSLLEFVVFHLQTVGVFKIKLVSKSFANEITNFLINYGFVYETKLSKEINGEDIYIFSKFIR